MKEYRHIVYHGIDLTISNDGEVYREAHTTIEPNGKVKNYPRRRMTSTREPSTGYIRVGLRINGILHNASVHRLVAIAFLGDPQPGQVVNHINEDRTDNRVENLEWVSQKDNLLHSARLHPAYKHNKAKKIAQIKDGKIINIFDGARDACRTLGLPNWSGINTAARGELKTCYGYNWKYV